MSRKSDVLRVQTSLANASEPILERYFRAKMPNFSDLGQFGVFRGNR